MDIESVSVRILYGHNNEGPSAKSFYCASGRENPRTIQGIHTK